MPDWRHIAPATLAVALGACLPGPRDLVVERCTEVIQYRSPRLSHISVDEIERGPGENEVTLQYEARDEAQDATLASRITCAFDPANRWSLVRVQLDGRELTEAEVALVNSEFLLRDLSESPERLGEGGPSR